LKDSACENVAILREYGHTGILEVQQSLSLSRNGDADCYDGEHQKDMFFICTERKENEVTALEVLQRIKLGEVQARVFFRQLLKACQNLKDYRLSHGDLKLENMIVSPDFSTIRLSNFQYVQHTAQPCTILKGTKQYMAPEILTLEGSRVISFDPLKSDVFALGVILYSSIIGRYPFQSASPTDLRYRFI
jgi:serine/threonine protein kinase